MATILNTTFRLKRGTATRWIEVNPVLDPGEPGFEIDTNRLKIGDGVTAWKDLPYFIGKSEVMTFSSTSEFPVIGDPTTIYRATEELSLYQFNCDTFTYEKISDGRGVEDIKIINGGNANGTD